MPKFMKSKSWVLTCVFSLGLGVTVGGVWTLTDGGGDAAARGKIAARGKAAARGKRQAALDPTAFGPAGAPAWASRQLRRLEAAVIRSGRSPLGVEPVLAVQGLRPRLPRSALGAFLTRALRRRPHPLVQDALRWLALAEARDRGDAAAAARHREALGLITDTWWLLGPFDNEGGVGLRRLQRPELAAGAPLLDKKRYIGKSAPVAWRHLPPVFPDGVLRPGELLEGAETGVVLLRTDVVARTAQVAALRLGTTGGYRVWLNGTLVAERTVKRPLRPDQDAVGVRLRKGRNALLVVLGTEASAPQLVVRLTAPAGGPLPGWAFAAPAGATGAPGQTGAAGRGAARGRRGAIRGNRGGRGGRARVWPAEPSRGASGSGVTVIGRRPKPVAGPKVITARAALEEAARKRPKDAALQAALARYHLAASPDDPREEQALAAARRALGLAPSAGAHLLVARSHAQSDPQRLALEAALRANPREVEALDALADHYYSAGQHLRAEALWRRARAADPTYLPAALRLAELAQVRRLPSEARRQLLRLVRRFPQRPDVVEALAALEQDLGLHAAARPRLETLWRTGQTNLGLLHRLAGLARQGLDPKATQRWLREMIRVRPSWLRAREELADSLAGNGVPEAGVRVLGEAIALAPDTHRLQVALGRVALRAGLRSVARRAIARALEIRPQDLARKRLQAYLERQGPDPLVKRWAVDAAAIARAAWKQPRGKEDAEVLEHLLAYDVLPSGLSRRFQQQVILIRSRKGVAEWHTHHLDYLPDTQQLEVRVARVIRPDGSEAEASQSDVALGDPSIRMYYDRRLKVIRFRGLRPGDVLELQTLLADIPAESAFKDYFGAILGLQTRAPIRHLQVAITLPPGRTLHVNKPALARLTHQVTRSAKGTLYRWDARDVPALEPEPLSPGWAEQQPYLHVSTFATWPEVARWYWGLVKEQFFADDALRQAAREAARGARTLREKVIAIYHLVVKKTRYVALAFGMHTYKPYSAPQVFARKFGDCKDKAMLMAVLLQVLGVESYPVLVRTRRGGRLADQPPSLAVFDHAILYVPALKLFLDGTAERTGATELPWADQGAMALIIDGKDGQRVRTPVLPASANHTARQLELTLAADGTAEVTERLVIRGQEAAWWRRSFTDPQTRRTTYEKLLSASFPRAKVATVTISDPEALEQPVTVQARYRVPGFARVAGRRMSVDLALSERPLTQQLAPLSTRTQPVVYRAPFSQSVTITVRWPKGWRVTSAPTTTAGRALGAPGTAALEATQRVQAAGNRLTVTRSLQVRRHRFPVAEYPALRRFWVTTDGALRQPLELEQIGGAP